MTVRELKRLIKNLDPQELLKKVKPQTPPYTFYVHPENRVKNDKAGI